MQFKDWKIETVKAHFISHSVEVMKSFRDHKTSLNALNCFDVLFEVGSLINRVAFHKWSDV